MSRKIYKASRKPRHDKYVFGYHGMHGWLKVGWDKARKCWWSYQGLDEGHVIDEHGITHWMNMPSRPK